MTISSENRIDHEKRLTSSLVVIAGRGDDYRNNAEFKHSVDILVRLLPFMVNGIGIQADVEQQDRQALIEQMIISSIRPFQSLA